MTFIGYLRHILMFLPSGLRGSDIHLLLLNRHSLFDPMTTGGNIEVYWLIVRSLLADKGLLCLGYFL